MSHIQFPSLLQYLWGCGGGGGGRRGWRAESGAWQVEGDVVLVAADYTSEVHPQGIQRAGVLRCVKLVGNLFKAAICLRQKKQF